MFKFFRQLTSLFAWLQIVISPILIGAIIGMILYTFLMKPINFLLAVIVSIGGFIVGIIWAEKVRKKTGTVEYMSKAISIPEVDNNIEVDKNNA
jgi:membrane associated rhomboid family serine protease